MAPAAAETDGGSHGTFHARCTMGAAASARDRRISADIQPCVCFFFLQNVGPTGRDEITKSAHDRDGCQARNSYACQAGPRAAAPEPQRPCSRSTPSTHLQRPRRARQLMMGRCRAEAVPCRSAGRHGTPPHPTPPTLAYLLLALLPVPGGGLFYDVIQPHQLPAEEVTCLPWDEAGDEINSRWATPGLPPASASNHCAQQGNGATATVPNGSARATSAYCVDRATRNISFCRSALSVPEQVNLQIRSPDSVVVGFVTFEAAAPTAPPTLLLSAVDGAPASATRHAGVTHVHKTGDNARTYYMHYILLANLTSRARYIYRVQSGAPNSSLSDRFSFRAPYSGSNGKGGATRIALFGDMGVYAWNCMGNLWQETVLNETADLIVQCVVAFSDCAASC